MATVANAISSLELNETPYWWLYSGTTKVGQSINTDNMADSIARFRQIVELQPHGNYKVTGAKNPNDNRGGTSINFTITKDAPANAMQSTTAAMSTNAYGIPDHQLRTIQEEARRTLLFEQMQQQFGPMADMVKDLLRRVEKMEKYLKEDEDGDGTPDWMQTVKTATDAAKSVGEIKSVFEGGLFGSK